MSDPQPLLRTLAIETSCDETAVAVLDGDGRLEANELSSQIAAHAPYGGVVPELASREHLKALPVLVERARNAAVGDIELVAVTAGPGLVGALCRCLRLGSRSPPGCGGSSPRPPGVAVPRSRRRRCAADA